MKVHTLFYIALATLVFAACGRQVRNCIIVSEFPVTIPLFTNDTLCSGFPDDVIFSVDTLLIIQTINSNTGILFVRDATSGVMIDTLVHKGRGPNEFLFLEMSQSNFKHEPDGLKIWVYDQTSSKYSKINLTKSIYNHRLILENQVHIPIEAGMAMRLSDQELLIYKSNSEPYYREFMTYNVAKSQIAPLDISRERGCNHQNFTKYNPFPELVPFDNQVNKIVVNYAAQNRFKIMNLTDRKDKYISVYEGPIPVADISDEYLDNTIYYYAFACTKQRIYGIYLRKTLPEILAGLAVPAEVHVYSVDGDPIACLKIEQPIRYISVPETDERLYGITPDGDIYSYDISSLLN